MKEKDRGLFYSLQLGWICCLIAVLSMLLVFLVSDSIEGIINLKIETRCVFFFIAVLLFFFTVLYSISSIPFLRSGFNAHIRFSIFIFRKYLAVFLVIALLISFVSCSVFLYLAKSQIEMVDLNLSRIAKMQVKQVNDWRDRQFHRNEVHAGNVEMVMFDTREDYESLARIAVNGKEVVYTGFANGIKDADSLFSLKARQGFIDVLKYRRIWIGSVEKVKDGDGKPGHFLAMYVPFMTMDPDKGKAGVEIHYVDPQESLMPMLSSWPVLGKTSRFFLFSCHGEGMTVLGKPSSDGGTVSALNLSEPNRERWLRKINDGEQGIFHESDYHGNRVLGYMVKIPDSDWSLIIKLDEQEAYSQIQQMAWYIFLIALLLIGMAEVSLYLVLRYRHMQRLTVRLKSGLRRKTKLLYYDYLSKFANDVIILMDGDGTVIKANDCSEKMFGVTSSGMAGNNVRTVFDFKNNFSFEEKWNELKREKSLIFEAYCKHTGGYVFPVEISSKVIETENRLFVQFIIRDISKKKKAEELIWKHANFDQITGLPNRRMFLERLFFETRKAYRTQALVALMFLDLDRFKDVNDTMGHVAGDLLLKEVGYRLKACVRETDMVARLGGDEFTVILADVSDFRDIERVAQNILDALAEPFVLEGQYVHIAASIGITCFPDDTRDIRELVKNADRAMYSAKSLGGNQYRYFTQSMQDAVQQRIHMINDLHVALENNQFEMVFQPIVDLKTGRMCRAEALIRWNHPVHGVLNPASFVPLAEDTGMIQAFGDWIFREAARQAVKCRKCIPDFQISFNVSSVQFKKGGIDTGAWLACLKKLSLPAGAIVVEITEGLLLDIDENITDQLLALRDMGIDVALDDFGTGYSSLAYLKKLDIDYMKIDRMFVRNLSASEEDRVLCEAMILMAHKLGIAVVAEGVETQDQLKILADFGCDYVQGYYISGPVNHTKFEEWFCRKQESRFPGIGEGACQSMTKTGIGEKIDICIQNE